MEETKYFQNDGFGWICKSCAAENKKNSVAGSETADAKPLYFMEGEAFGNVGPLDQTRARWADPAQRSLMCPRCGITELIDIR